MAADARTDLAPPRALSLAAVRVTPVQALTVVIAASVIGRTLAGWLRATPIYFPDEYIYSEVGRSIAEHGRPLVRGASAHFPALLQPLLTAPAWLFDDVATSFRTIQLINAVVMSLGAVAVFWLARRLGIGPWVAVALAAFTLAIPDMFYSALDPRRSVRLPPRPRVRRGRDRSSRQADQARAVRVRRLRRPRHLRPRPVRGLARVLRRRPGRSSASASAASGRRSESSGSPSGSSHSASIPVLVAGPRSVLGYYDSVVSLDLSPLPILRWMGADGMLLLYSSGWVLVPGALIGPCACPVEAALTRGARLRRLRASSRSRLSSRPALYAANGADRIQERYFFAVLPLDRRSSSRST